MQQTPTPSSSHLDTTSTPPSTLIPKQPPNQRSEEYPNDSDENNTNATAAKLGWWSHSGHYLKEIYSLSRDSNLLVRRNFPTFWRGQKEENKQPQQAKNNYPTDINDWLRIPYDRMKSGDQSRNHQHPNNSMRNVRRLLSVVRAKEAYEDEPNGSLGSWSSSVFSFTLSEEDSNSATESSRWINGSSVSSSNQPVRRLTVNTRKKYGHSETASRLGEGAIMALRDLCLDEALELHTALRYWTTRLDRPFLYYLESGGPLFGDNDGICYRHHHVAEKVSRLQAVLARRCSRIGELQQHLWRAGWQRGVAEWGILGQGSEFAVVAGQRGGITDDLDGGNEEESGSTFKTFFSQMRGKIQKKDNNSILSSTPSSAWKTGMPGSTNTLMGMRKSRKEVEGHGMVKITNEPAMASWTVDAIRVVRDHLYCAGSNLYPLPFFENWPREELYFLTDNKKDTVIIENDNFTNKDAAQNTKKLESSQLISDGIPGTILGESMMTVDAAEVFENETHRHTSQYDMKDLPIWAARSGDVINTNTNQQSIADGAVSLENTSNTAIDATSDNMANTVRKDEGNNVVITELGLMASEVNELVDSMEIYMKIQRKRRLDKLRPPSRLMRNWYIAAIFGPLGLGCSYWLITRNVGVQLTKDVYRKIAVFCAEHISEPLQSIFQELFTRKGRQDVTDRKARQDVIESLKMMIKSWLDENHPTMSEKERSQMATSMDMSLIEATKESTIKHILEINNIVRMSLIEMQFIKKEMMNALYAMDDLMGSNEINMKLAAMTPAFLILSFIRFIFRKLFYALLKVGKSKEQIYASIRHIILDIERLLVMRDGPPNLLSPLGGNINYSQVEVSDQGVETSSNIEKGASSSIVPSESSRAVSLDRVTVQHPSSCVLNSDDLGMLMLLIHECRTILWQGRTRFSPQELQNVLEDLAELAGERGAVSVQQQLRIIARMCRTYSFLKVVSSGIPFVYSV